MTAGQRVLVIPGLNGHPGLLMRSTPALFPDWSPVAFNHHVDLAVDGVEGLACRALGLVSELDEPVWVCGESFGGTVALTLAHLEPSRVRGLILLSAFGWHPSLVARRGVRALAVWSLLGGRISDGMYGLGRLVSMPTQLGLRFPPELLGRYIARPRAHVTAYRRKAELALTFDARPWLSSVACPTFVLVGTWDPVVPAAAGRELARSMPNATLHAIRGGHLVHLVHARRVGALIRSWANEA